MGDTLYLHIFAFYKELDERSSFEEVAGTKDVRIFRGSITRIYNALGISRSYYSKVRNALIEMGCLTILSQGNRAEGTAIVLHRAPTDEDFRQWKDRPLTKAVDAAILSQRVGDIEKRLGGLDVVNALIDFEERIKQQDERLRELEQEIQALKQVRPTPTRRI